MQVIKNAYARTSHCRELQILICKSSVVELRTEKNDPVWSLFSAMYCHMQADSNIEDHNFKMTIQGFRMLSRNLSLVEIPRHFLSLSMYIGVRGGVSYVMFSGKISADCSRRVCNHLMLDDHLLF